MSTRTLAALAATAAVLVLAAPSAQARDLAPGEAEWVITTADLTSPSGKVKDEWQNVQDSTIPSACSNVNSGRLASGRSSLSTVMGQIDYANGTTWQSAVWTYRTDAAAAASFAKLQKSSLVLCNDSLTGMTGDDVADMPAVMVDRAAKVQGGTQPRFAAASSQILLDPAHARPGYTNNHDYMVFTLVDDAIVQVNVFQVRPITGAQRADARQATSAIAHRYAASL